MTGIPPNGPTVAGIATRARAIAARHGAIILAALAVTLLGGCATATSRGQAALYSGRYDEAATRFEEALTREPESVAALVGLGITRYRLGMLDEAQRLFGEALRQSPDLPVAHLYLGLIPLLRGQDAPAAESLRRYVALGVPPRLAAHIERALRALWRARRRAPGAGQRRAAADHGGALAVIAAARVLLPLRSPIHPGVRVL